MTYISYILRILLYFAFVALMYYAAIWCRKRQIDADGVGNATQVLPTGFYISRQRLNIGIIVALCIMLGIYSIICGHVPPISDRGNYAFRFENAWDTRDGSVALYWVQVFLRLFTNNPSILFFSVSFLYLMIILTAYRQYPDVETDAILYLGLSSCCLHSFYQLKQAPAVALIALSIAAFMKRKKLLCLFTLILAISFHEAAYIMIPLYLVMLGAKSKWLRGLEYLFLALCVLFFYPITTYIVPLVTRYIPGMSDQLLIYIDSDGGIETSNYILTIVKGIPFYLITYYAFAKRSFLKDKIANYDRYMVLCIFASVMSILSGYMYWMWRFGSFCYFPMFVFASLIHREIEGERERRVFKSLLSWSLGVLTFRALVQFYFTWGGF